MSDALKEANQKLETMQQGHTKREANTTIQQSDNVAHALAGAGGGLLSMALTYPLITLSTRAQVESKRAQSSVFDAVRRILDREGVSGLFAGLDSALFGITVTNFVYYYWYEWTRAFLERAALARGRSTRKLTTLESMAAGAVAGSATVLITNPIWVVNTRMTARKNEAEEEESSSSSEKGGILPTTNTSSVRHHRPSTIATLTKMLREEGPSSLFAGVLPALVLVLNPILQYTVYEQLKNLLEIRRKRAAGPTDSFYLGAIGKLIATGVTYPYLTVKSRAHVAGRDGQAQGQGKGQGQGSGEGIFGSFGRILKEEGWSGLYAGVGPKVAQSVVTTAFLFMAKDVLFEAIVKARKEVGVGRRR